ncbi:classical arabinogalactan protein 4 [Stenotrophomonas sp. ISL-67]|uniref:classical arabinogalactan protein 4 n=1 Tax=Stenotrophomonas sp. ISL-67 TaxID=2819171 RepID=UPI001BE80EAE|nr:classical arabinogalactan protein 4 [Stenotrophomonas sp. ISL-67]MBT2768084.1 classical arabinogalactan protein 4 [Stenotrophomonas sp. ISL-67]
MNRLSWLALSLLVLVPLGAEAQIAAPRSPTDTRPATRPAPIQAPPSTPVRPAPADNRMAPVTTPAQTTQQLRTHPIQSQGPAQVVPPAPPATTAPPKVYDRHGRIIPGMKQVGPNRVLDTRTGRYYDAVPSGDGQRIKP